MEICRRLAADDPTAHEPDLALSPAALGLLLARGGNTSGALRVAEEAVNLYRTHAGQCPRCFPIFTAYWADKQKRLRHSGLSRKRSRSAIDSGRIRCRLIFMTEPLGRAAGSNDYRDGISATHGSARPCRLLHAPVEDRLASHMTFRLTKWGHFHDISRGLLALADNFLAQEGSPIDYTCRRALDYRNLLPMDTWTQRCRDIDFEAGGVQRPQRRQARATSSRPPTRPGQRAVPAVGR